jgi:hypothetical protein
MCRRTLKLLSAPARNCPAVTASAVSQEPMPSLLIERGRPGPGFLAHVLVSKYADHLPLDRQSQIYARAGVDLDLSTMAEWVGRMTSLLEPLADAIKAHTCAGEVVHVTTPPFRSSTQAAGRRRQGGYGLRCAMSDHGDRECRLLSFTDTLPTAKRSRPKPCSGTVEAICTLTPTPDLTACTNRT